MEKVFKLKTLFVLGLVLLFVVSGCFAPKYTNKITINEDIVNSSKRIEVHYFCKKATVPTSIYYMKQSVVKEIFADGSSTITVYDVLNLFENSFNLSDEVYLIVDDSFYQLKILKAEHDHIKTISENTDNIMTADSSYTTVVTGYSENNSKISKFEYMLTDEMIEKIKTANKVSYRYYAGPNMITMELKPKSLEKLKELILTQ